jgi:UDP-2,3-diacylglucosamine pyrophosphatase LpxH
MPEKSLYRIEKLPVDRSIIVVSDLHLGGSEDAGTAERFSRFLDYIATGRATVAYPCHFGAEPGKDAPAGPKQVFPPEKIILLGDVLELWDSRNMDRNSAFLDALHPFLKMKEMDCDVVYVTGNHDEDVAEIITSYDEERRTAKEARNKDKERQADDVAALTKKEIGQLAVKEQSGLFASHYELLHTTDKKGRKKAESLKFRWNGSRTLELCARHYPTPHAEDGQLGVEAGGIRYAFIHGQQFDREQITYSISEALGQRFDPVDFFQDLASISVTKRMNPVYQAVNFGLAVILLLILSTPSLQPLIPFIGAGSGIILALMFLYGTYLFGYAERGHGSSSLLAGISAGALAADAAVILGGLFFMPAVFQWLFWIPFVVSLYAFAVITIPVLFACAKRKAYNGISSKTKAPGEIISENLFDVTKYRYESKVLVFGHTHVADFEKETKTKRVSLLVNTGSWVHEFTDAEVKDCDTFAYIDRTGVCCLRWVYDIRDPQGGHIECYCRKKGTPPAEVPLCAYIRNNNLDLKVI